MKKIDSNKTYLLICSFYIVYYITLGVVGPYMNVYYERLGFGGSQIGLITSLGMIASMMFTPIWGVLSDKTKNPRAVIAFILVMAGITSIIWSTQTAFMPVMILSIILSVFRQNVWSLVDGVGIQFCSDYGKDFGFARSMGSLGYLLGSFAIANLMFALGFSGPYMQVFVVCSFAGAIMIMCVPASTHVEKAKEKVNFIDSLKELLTNRSYLFVVLMMLLTSLVVDTILNYSGNHLINALGQSDSMIGIFSLVQVFPEIIIVMFANRIFRRMKTSQVFMMAAVAQLIRFVLCAVSSNIVVFLLATSLHGVTIAVSSVGYVSYIQKHVKREILATAMALYGTAGTIGVALLNQLFGFVYEYASSYQLFTIGAIAAAIAMVILIFNKKLDEE
ncbi:MAG: MFS transporter [Erysipelotrichaceae bacterium]|nr:MFS transporter [Erysipelotrichaceae bacterium]